MKKLPKLALAGLTAAAFSCNAVDLAFYTPDAGGTGGASSTGSAMHVCWPGATQSCYGGPPGTAGVGVCKAGTQTCSMDGMGWGPCLGEVLPQPPDCASGKDLHCDGSSASCLGAHLWSKRFGDVSDQHGQGVAVDSSGNVFLTGYFSGAMDFGGGALTSVGSFDVYVAKLDPLGAYLWAHRFGGAGQHLATSIAVDPSGNAIVTGYFSGEIQFGSIVLNSGAGSNDLFVAKLDTTGACMWAKRFGSSGDHYATSVAVDASSNVLLTGYFSGAIDFGGGALASAGGTDAFVAKFDPSGGYFWAKRFGDGSGQQGHGVAVDGAGNVVATGYFNGAVDFGGGVLTSAGGADIYVVKLDSSGGYLWAKGFGDAADQYGASVAVDSAGSILLTGGFAGGVDFGGGTLKSAGAADIFLAKLDPSGSHVWAKGFGDPSDQYGLSIAVDAVGNAVVTGYFNGAADFGGGLLMSAGVTDVFAAKLDTSGGFLWAKRFGDPNNQYGASVAMDSAGAAVVTGDFFGTIDFGGNALVSMGGSDVFVAKLSP